MKVYPPFGVSSLGQVQLLVGLVNPGGSVPVWGVGFGFIIAFLCAVGAFDDGVVG